METTSSTPFPAYDKSELVDIRDVHVDPNLPKEARIAEFVRQIKTPISFAAAILPSTRSTPRTARRWRTV